MTQVALLQRSNAGNMRALQTAFAAFGHDALTMEKTKQERRIFDWGPPPNLPERRRVSEAMRITVTPISLEEWLQARGHDTAAYRPAMHQSR